MMPATPLTLHHGSCLDVLPTLADGSVDSIVTDPPYELGFMGKTWDASGIAYNVELWRQCLRVLKPGGHLLAFGGTRTYHRMACAIEDAGFEIRDSIHWLYGSGFPKSLDVSKAIDKAAGAERAREAGQRRLKPSAAIAASGFGADGWAPQVKTAITPAAAAAAGWATALKPAHEPIVVARKPLAGTVAANVLKHGTGALNIDGCRVGSGGGTRRDGKGNAPNDSGWENMRGHGIAGLNAGRWPANLVLTHDADCADTCAPSCPVAALDAQSGVTTSGAAGRHGSSGFADGYASGEYTVPFGDTGGASRFFTVADWDPIADAVPFAYIAKPSRAERDAGLDGLPERAAGSLNLRTDDHALRNNAITTPRQNHHPTVKPVELMRWLVRLVTPTGGTVLEPFAGSGTTLVAARLEGFAAVGIEMTADYLPIIEGRLAWAARQAVQLSLFDQDRGAA